MLAVNFNSIRVRLILGLALPMIAIGLGALLLTSSLLSVQANKVFDRMLLGAAHSIEQRLEIRDGQAMLDMPYFTLDTMESASSEKIFYRVERVDGELLAGFNGLPMPDTRDKSPQYYNTLFAGNDLRAVFIQIPGTSPSSSVYILVAESLHGRDQFTFDILNVLTIMALLTMILTMLTAMLAVRRGLLPLKHLSESIKHSAEQELKPLHSRVPPEVQPLVDSINYLIQRVRDNIEHIQYFNADVSHQLRTPLAEIKTLSELAQKELVSGSADPQASAPYQLARFEQIEQITDFLSRTTQQLLSYAKTRQSLMDQQMLQPLELGAFCRELVMQQAPRIYQRGGEIEFICDQDSPVWVRADKLMLTGALTNLIDNALIYGLKNGQPGLISVTVGHDNQSGWLCVQDEGPGIEDSQLASVTDRFVRLDQQTPGTGLGLAIVRQVCDIHQAQLELRNRSQGGLEVCIRLPLELSAPEHSGTEA